MTADNQIQPFQDTFFINSHLSTAVIAKCRTRTRFVSEPLQLRKFSNMPEVLAETTPHCQIKEIFISTCGCQRFTITFLS